MRTPYHLRVRRHRLDLDVSAAGVPGLGRLAADLVVPDGATEGPLLVCFPGGGMSRRYFDLPEAAGEQWSMAAHLADRFGLAVAMVDHPAAGESDMPDDPWVLVPTLVADVDVVGLRSLLAQCEGSDLWRATRLVGCGHSMGSMLMTRMQSRHRPFDAIVLLGYSGEGLPDHVPAAALELVDDVDGFESALPDLTRERFGAPLRRSSGPASDFLAPDASPEARRVIESASTDLLTMSALAAMTPHSANDAVEAIDVPVFLGVGERDIAGPPTTLVERLVAAPRVEAYVLSGAGHNQSISPRRAELWDAVGRFVSATAR